MAKLSTPSHPCATQYVNADGVPTRKCGGDAYRRIPKGHPTRECARCRHTRERFERSRQAQPAFQVIGRTGEERLTCL